MAVGACNGSMCNPLDMHTTQYLQHKSVTVHTHTHVSLTAPITSLTLCHENGYSGQVSQSLPRGLVVALYVCKIVTYTHYHTYCSVTDHILTTRNEFPFRNSCDFTSPCPNIHLIQRHESRPHPIPYMYSKVQSFLPGLSFPGTHEAQQSRQVQAKPDKCLVCLFLLISVTLSH